MPGRNSKKVAPLKSGTTSIFALSSTKTYTQLPGDTVSNNPKMIQPRQNNCSKRRVPGFTRDTVVSDTVLPFDKQSAYVIIPLWMGI